MSLYLCLLPPPVLCPVRPLSRAGRPWATPAACTARLPGMTPKQTAASSSKGRGLKLCPATLATVTDQECLAAYCKAKDTPHWGPCRSSEMVPLFLLHSHTERCGWCGSHRRGHRGNTEPGGEGRDTGHCASSARSPQHLAFCMNKFRLDFLIFHHR